MLITFDDAFEDFAQVAAPILQRHGFSALVFVPTRRLGRPEGWHGANDPASSADGLGDGALAGERRLRIWRAQPEAMPISPSFPCREREDEIAGCAEDLSAQIGKPVEELRGALRSRLTRGTSKRSAVITELPSERVWHCHGAGMTGSTCRASICTISARAKHWAGLLKGRRNYLRLRQSLRAVRSKVVTNTY